MELHVKAVEKDSEWEKPGSSRLRTYELAKMM
jgi:hypothetical protein